MNHHIVKEELTERVIERSGHGEQADGIQMWTLDASRLFDLHQVFLFFGRTMWHVGSRFTNQGLNLCLVH